MDECLQVLDEQPESPSDRTLVAMVRMQLLKEEAGKMSAAWRPETTFDIVDAHRTPPAMYVKLLQRQLQQHIQSLPSELQSTGESSPSSFLLLLLFHALSSQQLIFNTLDQIQS